MSASRQWIVVVAVVAALGIALTVGVRATAGTLDPVAVGSRAPEFAANAVAPRSGRRTLADYRGSVVLLNVWATWCAPCRVEMPSLERLHREFAPHGLRIVAVSIDDLVGARQIRGFADELNLTFEILHDSTRAIDRAYQLTGYPVTVLIDREGLIRRKHLGALQWDSDPNRRLIAGLLGVPFRESAERSEMQARPIGAGS